MAENKTQATDASVADYIDSRATDQQKVDCKALMALFKKVTKETPKMWGPSIVGYGKCRYIYESGRSGEMPVAGFAIRGREIVLYLDCAGGAQEALLSRIGKHTMSKSCFYFKRLEDLDASVLEQLVVQSVAETRKKYG